MDVYIGVMSVDNWICLSRSNVSGYVYIRLMSVGVYIGVLSLSVDMSK